MMRIPAVLCFAVAPLLACGDDVGTTTCTGDECQAGCATDRQCSDGDLCNGVERCGDEGSCHPGSPVHCGDALVCQVTGSCGCAVGMRSAADGTCQADPCAGPRGCEPACLIPDGPVLDAVIAGEPVTWTAPAGQALQVGFSRDSGASAPDSWTDGDHLTPPAAGVPYPVTLFARLAAGAGGCEEALFTHTTLVTSAWPGGADAPDSQALGADDPAIVAWATGWVEPIAFGSDVEPQWRDPTRALGPPIGDNLDVISLGNGGVLTLTFDRMIGDGPGPDLVVFENAANDTFLELAYVEVSSNGVDFARFDSGYLGVERVSEFGAHEPSLVAGLAGKYRTGFGTPFDLASLRYREVVQRGLVDLDAITHVRVVDIIGDGTSLDSFGRPIYDPTPTRESGGFDLDAVGVLSAER